MLKFIGRRVISAIPVLVVVSFAVFLLIALVPGDPALLIAGPEATPEQVAEVRERYHFNEPLVVQYGYWLFGVLRLDFGLSLYGSESVSSQIASRLPVTLGLAIAAAVCGLLIAVPLGLAAGIWPNTWIDSIARSVATLGLAIPNFVFAILLVMILAVNLRWLPTSGYADFWSSPLGWLRFMILPALTLGLHMAAILVRQIRAALMDVLDSNYVRSAWARGASPRLVVMKHGLKNAAIPAVTVLGVQVGYLLGGTVIIEQIFAIPGLGSYMLTAILRADLPVIQAVTLVFVVTAMLMSLLVDISYGFLNPKIKVS
ncbi:ABC transporter permease [Microbacterium sp. zg.B48]|uniref:ABC transporter permease n=1 Tax=Microbacterium sp. zg.B48 TaxID=2969408 RepID=UPI00214CA691|nr:ABC transporter permease [Microbacterium sp. zg.B48]MCR2764362.1 ABC transporter permease [Microbacterium sp. zg.B48]